MATLSPHNGSDGSKSVKELAARYLLGQPPMTLMCYVLVGCAVYGMFWGGPYVFNTAIPAHIKQVTDSEKAKLEIVEGAHTAQIRSLVGEMRAAREADKERREEYLRILGVSKSKAPATAAPDPGPGSGGGE